LKFQNCERKETGQEKLMTNLKLQIQDAQRTSGRINTKIKIN
jgi:hypothetical protein